MNISKNAIHDAITDFTDGQSDYDLLDYGFTADNAVALLNLTADSDMDALVDGLTDIYDGMTPHDIVHNTGVPSDRADDIYALVSHFLSK